MSFSMQDYVEVPERILEFRKKYPEGVLQSEILELPLAFADKFIAVKAYAYRTPDDSRPGIGVAWENVPGKTPYTRDSELMNAETSAWGRALIAVGAADAKRGIASADEVRGKVEEPAASPVREKDKPMAEPEAPEEPQIPAPDRALMIPLRKAIKQLDPQQKRVDFEDLQGMTLQELQEVKRELEKEKVPAKT